MLAELGSFWGPPGESVPHLPPSAWWFAVNPWCPCGVDTSLQLLATSPRGSLALLHLPSLPGSVSKFPSFYNKDTSHWTRAQSDLIQNEDDLMFI